MLDKEKAREYNIRVNGLVAQLGAHHIRIVGVEGSNPFKSTKRKNHPPGWFFFLVWYSRRRDSNNPMQQSGGLLPATA